jgi:hypothetical protein
MITATVKPPNITEEGPCGGRQAERWAATLPNMKRLGAGKGKYDLIHEPSKAKVEVKFSNIKTILHETWDATLQFLWNDIIYGRFDWLLLIGKHDEGEYDFWIEPDYQAFWLLHTYKKRQKPKLTRQIIYGINAVNPRRKARYLRENRLSLEELCKRCTAEKLGN